MTLFISTKEELPLIKNIIKWIKENARKLKGQIDILLLCYHDPRTPWYAKAFAAVVVAYAFSPIDLIPDFIPILGYLDDLILVPLGIWLALRMIPEEVMKEAREQVLTAPPNQKPKNWLVAGIILLIWLGMIVLVFYGTLQNVNH